MRKAGTDASEAFELFLDTISNAFGGIIFIALLVCILLQLSGRSIEPRPEDRKAAADLQKSIVDLQAEVARLLAIKSAQVAQIDAIGTPTPRGIVVAYADLKEKEDAAQGRLAQLGEEEGKVDKDNADAGKELENLPKVPPVGAGGGVSTATDTQKKQVPILLTGKRMAFVFRYEAAGDPVGLNSDDIDVNEAAKTIVMKVGRGGAVSDVPAFHADLTERLKPFKPDKHTIAVAVWPDSYPEFELIRKKIMELGFGYGLLLLTKDEPVRTGGTRSEEMGGKLPR